MLKTIFGYDGPLMTFLMRVWNCVWLSLLFYLCALPVFTMGLSYGALYCTIRTAMRHERGYVTPVFFTNLKNNAKQGALAGVILTVIGFLLLMDYEILHTILEQGSFVGQFQVLILLLGAALLLYALWLFACICRFTNTIRAQFQNAAILAFSHLGTTLLFALVICVAGLVSYMFPLLFAITPALSVWVIAHLMEKIFRAYMTKEDIARLDEEEAITRQAQDGGNMVKRGNFLRRLLHRDRDTLPPPDL